jgi:hypothetical protein
MTLGDRCDEIVRLIDETLVSVAADGDAVIDTSGHPSGAGLLGRGTRPLELLADRHRGRRPHIA